MECDLKEDEHLDQTGNKIYVAPDAQMQQARDQKEQTLYSGFIAQEVEAVAISVGYNFNGVVTPDNEEDLYGLQYSQFVVPLVKALQELSVENHELREKSKAQDVTIENLIQRLEKLEAMSREP